MCQNYDIQISCRTEQLLVEVFNKSVQDPEHFFEELHQEMGHGLASSILKTKQSEQWVLRNRRGPVQAKVSWPRAEVMAAVFKMLKEFCLLTLEDQRVTACFYESVVGKLSKH